MRVTRLTADLPVADLEATKDSCTGFLGTVLDVVHHHD